MKTTSCPSEEQLDGYLKRGLPPTAALVVEAHVDECPDCQQALDRMTDCRSDAAFRGLAPARETWADLDLGRQLRDIQLLPARPLPARVSQPRLAADSVAQLRSRLRTLHTVVVGALGYSLWACLAGLPSATHGLAGQLAEEAVLGGLGQALLIAVVAYSSVSTMLLWTCGHRLRERVLRWLDTGGFAMCLCLLSSWHYRMLLASPPGGFDSADAQGLWQLYALTHSLLSWNVVMVGEGLYVPQRPRRCAVLMAMGVAVAFASSCAAAWAAPTVARALPMILLEQVAILGVTAVLCVTSTARIRALEQAATDLGQYRLQRLLGAGGMGEVWLAEHRLLKRPCAVKLIRPERADDSETLRRFEREVRATVALRHPHVVEVYDYGHAEDGRFYYVMEYLPGLSLDELVRRGGPLPPARAVALMLQVCTALRAAHAAGLVHRDIKPGNILVTENGADERAVLLDFGLVRPLDGSITAGVTTEGRLLGTPGFMAPEQIEGRGDQDARSDLYSLGAVAYFLLVGVGPFERGGVVQTLMAHLREEVPPLPDLGPAVSAEAQARLGTIVGRCLAKDPARRVPNAASLGQELKEWERCFADQPSRGDRQATA